MRVSADSANSGSWASSEGTRRSMHSNRRRDTGPEMAVRRALHAFGLRYRVDYPLPFDRRRKADVAFPRQRIAVFIDGCFWHGFPEHYVAPKAHADYWRTKIAGNVERDTDSILRLLDAGWIALRYWEHEIPMMVARSVKEAVAAAGSGDTSR